MTLYDVATGESKSFPRCLAGGSATGFEAGQGSAGRLLVGCSGHAYLLTAATGAMRALPQPTGALYGRWRTVGSQYVEGEADPGDCAPSDRTPEPEPLCRALFDIATGAVSYVPGDQVPDLNRVGAPEVCAALRSRLLFDNYHGLGAFAYGPEWLFTQSFRTASLKFRSCAQTLRTIPAGGAAENLCFGAGLLTWDVARDGVSGRVEGEGGPRAKRELTKGRAWAYEVVDHRISSFPLPLSHLTYFGQHFNGVFGYAAHAGRTLFWIAATKTNAVFVESAAIYALVLPNAKRVK